MDILLDDSRKSGGNLFKTVGRTKENARRAKFDFVVRTPGKATMPTLDYARFRGIFFGWTACLSNLADPFLE